MYFGFEEKNGFRLSLEGAQIIGPHAKKQVLELNEEQLKEWFNGQNLKTESIDKGFTLLKRKNDYVGCGFMSNGIVYNFIPKNRRLREKS